MTPAQLGLPGMPEPLFACTPTKLATYSDCPRRYRMTYVDRPAPRRGGAFAHNSMGAACHNALKQWWDLPPGRRTPAAGGTLLDGAWTDEGFRDPQQSASWRGRARRWVADYTRGLDPRVQPPGIERQVAATTGRLAISGRVDRVDERDGELVVVDYKTGRRELGTDDARGSQALAFYVLGVRRTMHRPCTQVELHHLPSGRVASFSHDDASLARQVRRAEQTAADIITATDTAAGGGPPDEVFPARPGAQCGWCDLRAHCREGAAASRAREPWSGLPDVDSDQPQDRVQTA
ncbi:MAG: RecB family exonuclease [Mycobacteriales bacterium]